MRQESLLQGNPLLNQDDASAAAAAGASSSFGAKRRWDDDVVFKNCTRGVAESHEKRFINDTLRSDFHRKFMSKFIK